MLIPPNEDGSIRVPETFTDKDLAPYGVKYGPNMDLDDICGWVKHENGTPCGQCYESIAIAPAEVQESLNIEQKETINVGVKEEVCTTVEQLKTLQK